MSGAVTGEEHKNWQESQDEACSGYLLKQGGNTTGTQLHIVTYNRHSEKYDNTKKVKMVKIVLFHYRNLFTGKQTNE